MGTNASLAHLSVLFVFEGGLSFILKICGFS